MVLAFLQTSDNTGQKFVTHHLHKWHRPEAVRRPSGNRTASVFKKKIFGGRRGSEY